MSFGGFGKVPDKNDHMGLGPSSYLLRDGHGCKWKLKRLTKFWRKEKCSRDTDMLVMSSRFLSRLGAVQGCSIIPQQSNWILTTKNHGTTTLRGLLLLELVANQDERSGKPWAEEDCHYTQQTPLLMDVKWHITAWSLSISCPPDHRSAEISTNNGRYPT